MYFCYIDESGTAEFSGNTSHFVLAGLSIPVWHWKDCERDIDGLKKKYSLGESEIHVAWILRSYLEQSKIDNFEGLTYKDRRSQVDTYRKAELLRLQRTKNNKLYKQTKKNYKETESYTHLTYNERKAFAKEIAQCISSWGFARLFAECIDKVFFDPAKAKISVDEQAFEQIVSRFEHFLQNLNSGCIAPTNHYLGLIIHDNNQTIAKKHTEIMRRFHKSGTIWTDVKNIIETPLFVDSQLTNMVQIADVCAYSLRRYLENNEDELFKLIFQRADRKDGKVVGVRHFTKKPCKCMICTNKG